MIINQSDIEHFWRHVLIPLDRDCCWMWLAYKSAQGYGQFRLSKAIQKAHRVSFEINIGPIPEGLFVCHSCDNPPCVNPDHLFLGTNWDNTHDKVLKGRAQRLQGESHGRSKLTSSDVIDIRARLATGNSSQQAIASLFGVNRSIVSSILRGKLWKHIQ